MAFFFKVTESFQIENIISNAAKPHLAVASVFAYCKQYHKR